jgi:hypothetical protein
MDVANYYAKQAVTYDKAGQKEAAAYFYLVSILFQFYESFLGSCPIN